MVKQFNQYPSTIFLTIVLSLNLETSKIIASVLFDGYSLSVKYELCTVYSEIDVHLRIFYS